jgi:hypothetical protein
MCPRQTKEKHASKQTGRDQARYRENRPCYIYLLFVGIVHDRKGDAGQPARLRRGVHVEIRNWRGLSLWLGKRRLFGLAKLFGLLDDGREGAI